MSRNVKCHVEQVMAGVVVCIGARRRMEKVVIQNLRSVSAGCVPTVCGAWWIGGPIRSFVLRRIHTVRAQNVIDAFLRAGIRHAGRGI